MTLTQAQAYLERIGCQFTAPDAANLASLQHRHLVTVPYENLDILDGKRIVLDEEPLFDKIVTRSRGGYCFELNRLFGELLRALGYEVRDYSARYLRGEDSIPMRRHHILRVGCVDGEFLCDVGVGEPLPMEPVPYLTREVFTDSFGGKYFFREDEFLGHVLCEIYKGKTRDYLSFTEEGWVQPDYETLSFWCEFAPQSPFTKANMLAIRRDPDERVTLNGNVLHIFSAEGVEEKILDEAETVKAIAEIFGIKR